ncbi:MAG: hypothetical protein K0U93_10170 [Gammaproteobacteria bacterium]|nr:hypothetical protein [Gammaproteobacteria bacterium]
MGNRLPIDAAMLDVHCPFTVVRPYPQPLRRTLVLQLAGLGLQPGISISSGTPDAPAARRVMESNPSVLVLPFHQHRDWDGHRVTGFGIAYRLGDEFVARNIPILMPVDDIALHSIFPTELDRLQRICPRIFARLVVHRVTGSAERLRSALEFAAHLEPGDLSSAKPQL